jgi:hypothetical protein
MLPPWRVGRALVVSSKICYRALMDATEIYRTALERIARCDEKSCERYVAVVDAIACEALALAEALPAELGQQRG